MKLRPAITAVALALVCLGAAACHQTDKKSNLPVKAEPEVSSETTTPAQWQPKHQPEGQLSVTVVPANAKIDLVSLGEQDGILPVKIKVLNFGHNNGNPNNRKEDWAATLHLKRSRFITQVFDVTELNREVTQMLVRVSFEPGKIRESFERAAKAYRMPVAYPTYIPWGYELDMNEFHAGAMGSLSGTWWLVWARGASPVSWGHGRSSITMRFPGRPTLTDAPVTLFRSKPEKFRNIKVDDQVKAKLSERRAIFIVDGLETWEILFRDISATEAEKIVKGMRFVEYDNVVRIHR